MKRFTPMLFTTLNGYSRQQFIKDVIAGIITAIIALPLSIALALASGVGPEQGIYTAVIAGFLISFFGGSAVQIAGPTAAFATIVAGIVAEHGMDGLILATIMSGIILLLMGLFRFGTLIKFIPYTITTGFTAGIAVTIFIGQWKDFFGVSYANGRTPIETLDKLSAFFENFSTWNPYALLVGVVSLAILILWPHMEKRLPPSLVAVIAGALMVQFFNLPVNTIGNLYAIRSELPALHLPAFAIQDIRTLLPGAFTIAVLAAIESLLSCVVADGLINSRHRSNMELMAQGIGNIGSALFGGIPATGAIARTAANIKNGGRTPVAGMVHSLVLVLVLVVLMPYAALIPMPVIAAILFVVAYNMCQWRPFVRLLKSAPKSDNLVLVATFLLTVVFDLVVAIEIGMLFACLLFMKRMSEETNVRKWKHDEDRNDLLPVPASVRVYEINGPLFFGVADRVADISIKDVTRCLIIRMGGVPSIDVTALNELEALYDRCMDNDLYIVFSHVNKQPLRAMIKAGFVTKVGPENFCDGIDTALSRAKKIIDMELVEEAV